MARGVVIVGGGITGLVAAVTLSRERPDVPLALLEASDRLGGKLRTEHIGAVQIEAGADSFLDRTTEGVELCRILGIGDELLAPAVFGGLTWIGGRLRRLPPGTVMGVPASPAVVARARALSPAGKVRAWADLVLPGRLSGHDISVGELVRRRFGREALERLVDPLLAGTRAGAPDEISLRAALPEVDRAARSHRSVMRGLRAIGGSVPDAPPRFLAPKTGMGRIVEALRSRLGHTDVRTGTAATRIERARRGYTVETGAGDRIEARGVVLAVPAHAATSIVEPLSEAAASGLDRIRHASVAVIALVYEAGSLSFPSGSSGFLVPSSSSLALSAGTWWSAKWPHTVPGNEVVVRAFVGRAGRHEALDLTDEDLARRASDEVGEVLGSSARPVQTRVTRWDEGLPQYEVGHWGRVSRIEGALEPHHGVVLAGADYRGSGIPDCIGQGVTAARRIAAAL